MKASGLPAEIEEILLVPAAETIGGSVDPAHAVLPVNRPRAGRGKRSRSRRCGKSLPRFPTTMVLSERRPEHARITHVHKRGEFLKLGEAVEPGVPAVLHPLPPGARPDRLTLARWLVDERNPLVGRVVMNQVWQTLFGRGLVTTTEDFGTQGARPTHPELLDWLATEFMRQGWSLKAHVPVDRHERHLSAELTRQRRSSWHAIPGTSCWRVGPRFRVPAETVRDIALAASGLLDRGHGRPERLSAAARGGDVAGLWHGGLAHEHRR